MIRVVINHVCRDKERQGCDEETREDGERKKQQVFRRASCEAAAEVTALHSHMLTESPRLFFMHFWANDDAIKLAKGLRAALDKTARLKS